MLKFEPKSPDRKGAKKMPEQVAYLIVGSFVSAVIGFIVWALKKNAEVKPHKTPCDHLVQLREDHEKLTERVNDHCTRESAQWNQIAQSLGFMTGTIEQLNKRFDNIESFIMQRKPSRVKHTGD